jgi:hypothetical protein
MVLSSPFSAAKNKGGVPCPGAGLTTTPVCIDCRADAVLSRQIAVDEEEVAEVLFMAVCPFNQDLSGLQDEAVQTASAKPKQARIETAVGRTIDITS